MPNSICDSIQENLINGWNSYDRFVNKKVNELHNYFSNAQHPLNPAYVELLSTINSLSKTIENSFFAASKIITPTPPAPTLAQLKQERANLNLNDVSRVIQSTNDVIPQFYKPVWLSNDQMCKWKVVVNDGEAEGNEWGIYQGKKWSISTRADLADSYFITHKWQLAAFEDPHGPCYWLMERIPKPKNSKACPGIKVYVYV